MGYKVKWVEENLGVSRKALRGFEKLGLMPPNEGGGYRDYSDEDTVFRANRLIDLVITLSMLPAIHSSIMRLNSSRFLVLVPDMPSSAKMPASSQSGWLPMYAV